MTAASFSLAADTDVLALPATYFATGKFLRPVPNGLIIGMAELMNGI